MISVTFQGPVVIDPAKLPELIDIVGAPVLVGPANSTAATNDAGAVTEQATETPPNTSTEAPPSDKPKRKRRTKAEIEADEAAAKEAAAGKNAGEGDTGGSGDAPSASDLMERFAKLIDADFDKAKALLDEMGAEKFSSIPEAEYQAFDAKLTDLGF